MKDRVIFHVDVNSAFLSWEAVYRIRECKAEPAESTKRAGESTESTTIIADRAAGYKPYHCISLDMVTVRLSVGNTRHCSHVGQFCSSKD